MQIENRRRNVVLWAWILSCILFLAGYVFVYLARPFPAQGNDIFSNLFGVLAAVISAAAATLLWREYKPADPPRAIWGFFALGLWAWCTGDAIWMVYNLTLVDVPTLSLADLFYLSGYVLFAAALHRQYRSLYRPTRRKDLTLTSIIVACVLLGTLLIQLTATGFDLRLLTPGGYLNFLYATGELAIASIAIIYSFNFGRGVLARPWMGLAVFAIADALYAWLVESGNYAFSLAAGNIPSLLADTSYNAAYLVLALGLIMQIQLVKYGPEPAKAT